MDDVAIRVENLAKAYRLGGRPEGYRTLRESIMGALGRPGRAGPGPGGAPAEKADAMVWALRDVSFEIKVGEVVGIIGRNGAGKSTLLKVLSRITEPTRGHADIHGRMGSLLEVGSGFHPELSGRENIFLNGAILGMKRAEIRKRFDEIVAFAEVERFIDTPVKHYSSGMYLRLAFGVAAHLEPEILVVDEVLAVGDVHFQKKCIAKMESVATSGRTVLLVSHNMGVVGSLCEKSILLEGGRVARMGPTSAIIADYFASYSAGFQHEVRFAADRSRPAWLEKASIARANPSDTPVFTIHDELEVRLTYGLGGDTRGLNASAALNRNGYPLLLSFDTDLSPELHTLRPRGVYEARLRLPRILKAGKYSITFSVGFTGLGSVDKRKEALAFEIEEIGSDVSQKSYSAERAGEIMCPIPWSTRPVAPGSGPAA